jgi:large subunit ribosomal protein L4
MSPASPEENPEVPTQPESAAETPATGGPATGTPAAGTPAAETSATETAASDTPAGEQAAEPAADEAAEAVVAETADAPAEAADAPAEEAKPSRRRAAAGAGETARPAARGGRGTRPAAKAPAKKRRPATASTEVQVELPAEIFDATVNLPLIHQVVVAQQAAARQGTHATKTRGEVRGGGRKPYRQKGTGRARQGSVRAPQFTGGGIAGGPVSRSHAQKTPKKMKTAALRGALSDRARHGLVQVVSGFVDGELPKTADAVSVLSAVTRGAAGASTVLVVADSSDHLTWKSLRNATGVHLIDPGQLNTYDVLTNDRVIFTAAAYESFVARVGAGSSPRANTAGGQEEQ